MFLILLIPKCDLLDSHELCELPGNYSLIKFISHISVTGSQELHHTHHQKGLFPAPPPPPILHLRIFSVRNFPTIILPYLEQV